MDRNLTLCLDLPKLIAMRHPIHNITIRRATGDDYTALARLAALDSAHPLGRDALIAEVGDEPWAAIELADGRVIADPFRATGDLVELLQLRAARMREDEPVVRRALGRLRLRSATA